MNARQELDSYISQLERRVRLDTLSRGAAILAATALGATVVLVLLANLRAFSEGSVIGARLTLVCILVFAASMGLAIPISRLSRRRAARKAEEMFPEFQQRLVTFAEKRAPTRSWSCWPLTRSTSRAVPHPRLWRQAAGCWASWARASSSWAFSSG